MPLLTGNVFDGTVAKAFGGWEERKRRRKRGPRGSFLYLLRHPWQPLIKVGITASVFTRVTNLASGMGWAELFPPVVAGKGALGVMRLTPAIAERHILTEFRRDRFHGEWLRRSGATLAMERALGGLESSVTSEDRRRYANDLADAMRWPKELLLV